MSENQYLSERLEEVENAVNNLSFMLENEDSKFYGDEFMKQHLSSMLFESAAIRRKLAELKHG